MEPIADTFDAAFSKTVDLANKMADKDKDADLWDIADGLLAGAIQYWLYSRQPCGDSRCQDCMPISTAEGRMSAWILGLLPFAVGAMLLLVNPKYTKVLWTDPLGVKMLWMALVMIIVGVIWLKKVIRIRI